MTVLESLLAALDDGSVGVVDLTQPLSERTPVIHLPEPFANTPRFRLHELSRYDDRGPAWYWNWFETGEHTGTHLDAPVHWVTGKDGEDIAAIPLRRLIGPAFVIDRTEQAAADPDYLLTEAEVREFEERLGGFPPGSWLLLRTGWGARADDEARFLNADDSGSHTPGMDAACARFIAGHSGLVGVGVETVGTDAGAAHSFDPPFPCHHFVLGAGKYGLTQLANLERLPERGAVLVVAPLKIPTGSGSPVRAFALVPSA